MRRSTTCASAPTCAAAGGCVLMAVPAQQRVACAPACVAGAFACVAGAPSGRQAVRDGEMTALQQQVLGCAA